MRPFLKNCILAFLMPSIAVNTCHRTKIIYFLILVPQRLFEKFTHLLNHYAFKYIYIYACIYIYSYMSFQPSKLELVLSLTKCFILNDLYLFYNNIISSNQITILQWVNIQIQPFSYIHKNIRVFWKVIGFPYISVNKTMN